MVPCFFIFEKSIPVQISNLLSIGPHFSLTTISQPHPLIVYRCHFNDLGVNFSALAVRSEVSLAPDFVRQVSYFHDSRWKRRHVAKMKQVPGNMDGDQRHNKLHATATYQSVPEYVLFAGILHTYFASTSFPCNKSLSKRQFEHL